MRLLTLGLILGVLSSCGPKTVDTPPQKNSPQPEQIVQLSQNIVVTANNETEGEVVSFGTYTAGTVKTVRVTITNSSASSIQLNDLKSLIEAWDDATSNPNSVTVVDSTSTTTKCVSRTISKTKSCFFDVTLSYNVELDNNSLIIPIRGTDALTAPTLNFFMDVSEAYLQSEATINAGASLVKNTEVLNFGTLLPNTSVTRRLYIANTNTVSDIAAPDMPATLPVGVTVERNICSGNIKAKGQCFIDFKYTHQISSLNSSVNFTSTQLTEGQKSLQLVATSVQDNVAENAPKLSFVYENFPASTDAGGSYIRRLTITNNSDVSSYTFGPNETGALFTDPSLTVLRNTCDGKILLRNKLCYIDVQHQPTVNNQQIQITLALPGANVAPQIIISGPAPVACTPGNSGIANAASVSGNTPACTLVSCNSNYDKVGNDCVAQACDINDFNFAATLSGNKAIGCAISTCQNNYSLNNGACSPTLCAPSDIANSATVSGDKVNGCVAVTCNATFSQIGGVCVSSNVTRACQAQPSQSTGGLETSIDGGVTFGVCSNFICNTNYSVSGNSCIPTLCSPADVANAATVSGDKVSGCTALTCNATFSPVGGACVSSNVTRVCQVQPSNSNGGLETSIDGGVTFGTCADFSCNNNYSLNNNECTPSACNVEDYPGAAAVSGDKVAGCIVDSCTSINQEVENNSCVDKVPSGNISLSGQYTQNASNLEVSVSSTNAQQIQLYSDAACASIDDIVPANQSTIFVNRSGAEGQKFVSAKFINGSKQSDCVSQSIVLDTQPPQIAVTIPEMGSQVSGSSLNILGTCIDAGSGIASMELEVNGMTQGTVCSGGFFSGVFDMSSMSAGQYFISVTSIDQAGNQLIISSSFEKSVSEFTLAWSIPEGGKVTWSKDATIFVSNSPFALIQPGESFTLIIDTENGFKFTDWGPSGYCSGSTSTTCEVTNVQDNFSISPSISQKECSDSMRQSELDAMGISTDRTNITIVPTNSNLLAGSLYPECTLQSGLCQSGNQLSSDQKKCYETCDATTSGISGALVVSGNTFEGCTLVDCQPGYNKVGETCQLSGSPLITASIDSATVNSYDFGTIGSATTVSKIITFRNDGDAALNNQTAYLDNTDFELTQNNCVNSSLAPTQTCTVTVQFNSAVLVDGSYSANLIFENASVALTGVVSSAGTISLARASMGYSTNIIGSVVTATGSGVASTGTGASSATGTGPSYPTTGGATFAVDTSPAVPVSGATAQNFTTDSEIPISLNISPEGSSFPTCTFSIPMSPTPVCSSSFTINNANIKNFTTSGSFNINFTGGSAVSIPYSIYEYSQVWGQGVSWGLNWNNAFYMAATDPAFTGGTKLFKMNTNGTIVKISNISGTTNPDAPSSPLIFNGAMYLNMAITPAIRIYRVSTSDAITRISNLGSANGINDDFSDAVEFGGSVYFTTQRNTGINKMLKMSTANAFTNVIGSSTFSDNAAYPTVYNGFLYFTFGSSPNKLFKMSTAGVISRVSNIRGTAGDDRPQPWAVFGGNLYLWAFNASGARKLYKMDSSEQFTQVLDIKGVATGDTYSNTATEFNGELYFVAYNTDAGNRSKIYKIKQDGTVVQVSNLRGNTVTDLSSIQNRFVEWDGSLFFSANNASNRSKLHRLDANGVISQVADVRGAGTNDAPNPIGVFNGALYVTMSSPSGVQSLYKFVKK